MFQLALGGEGSLLVQFSIINSVNYEIAVTLEMRCVG